jgi:hypothetical protein
MSVNTKYTDKPNDQYQRANLKGLVGYFHKRYIKAEFSKETVFGPTSVKWIGENQFLLGREYFKVDTITGNQDKVIEFNKVTIEKKTSR